MSQPILFKPTHVIASFDLLRPDGTPYVMPESAGDELMAKAFVDNYNEGFGTTCGSIDLVFKHPMEVTPANLFALQQEVIQILERHEREEAMKKSMEDDADRYTAD